MAQRPKGVYSTQGASSSAAGMTPGRLGSNKRLWLVTEHDDNYVEVQPINKNLVPVGQKRLVTIYEFENEYHVEPQFVVDGGEGKVRPVWKASRPVPPERDEMQDFNLKELFAEAAAEAQPPSPPEKDHSEIVLENPIVSQKDEPDKAAGKQHKTPAYTKDPQAAEEHDTQASQEELGIPPFEDAQGSQLDLDDDPFDDSFLEEFLAKTMGEPDSAADAMVLPEFPPRKTAPQVAAGVADDDEEEPQLLTSPIAESPRTPKDRPHPEPAPAEKGKVRLDVAEVERIEREARSTFGLGLSHLKRGNKDRAKGLFQDVAAMDEEFDPEHKHMFNEFGINLRKSGMPDVALLHYNRALEISPNDENLRHNLARIYYELGDTESCARELQKSLELNPDLQYAQRFLRHVTRGGRKKRGLFQGLLPGKKGRRK